MLDINLIREHPEIVEKDLEKRGLNEKIALVGELRKKDAEWKNLKMEVDALRHSRNSISKEVGEAKKAGKDAKQLLKKASEIPILIAEKEVTLVQLEKEIREILMSFPNILDSEIPVGLGEQDNKTVRTFGKKPNFKFPVKSHVDILEELKIADIARAGKISGARFWFLKGELELLEMALRKYALDFLYKKGFTPIEPPFMISRKPYEGVVDIRDFEDVMYKIEGEDLYLIATSEHPLTAMFMDEILEEEFLPIKLAGNSTNFRKEAGSHSKDTKGIFRGHQFNKIEQVVICKPEDSKKHHQEILKNLEDFFKSLGLHCRTVLMCTAEMGTVASIKYDLEAWMPAQNCYREVGSCSNCTDYQARRLAIRYRTKEGNKFVHTLNSTCIATSRALVAIIENFQQKDGSIKVPKILVKYMDGMTVIGGKIKQKVAKKTSKKAKR